MSCPATPEPYDRGSSTEPDSPVSCSTAKPRHVFAHLVPSTHPSRALVEGASSFGSPHHLKFLTSTEFRGAATPCFEIALDNLGKNPSHFAIGLGREGEEDDLVDFKLHCVAVQERASLAGVHATLGWKAERDGFFITVYNRRNRFCTVNGVDMSRFGDSCIIPYENTIQLGDYSFRLQYVRRDPADEQRFLVELSAFKTTVLHDVNPLVSATPREQNPRLGGDWAILCALGRGTYGIVHAVVNSQGARAAAKQLFRTDQNKRTFEQEVRMTRHIKELSHTNILRPFKVIENICLPQAEIARVCSLGFPEWDPGSQGNITAEAIFLSPYVPVNLRAVIGDPSLSDLSRNILLAGVLSGVAYIHEQGLMHRDLKPANVMIVGMEPPTPKITDFGSMCEASNRAYDKPGTLNYLAPEQVWGKDHNMKVDEWACALMGIELVTRKETRSRAQTTCEIQHAYSRLRDVDPELKVMSMCCRRMLVEDPEERMAAEDAFNILFYQGGSQLKQALGHSGLASGASAEGTKRKRVC